ncbi:S66 family peptidase [Scopulibacillus cellulosilyticus]|uniref:S66 peptidase family protein n=1 Tax=Scopulibacillus cellulosilyticus TaxID=2665665 RepID=A0ABW2PXJ9_9BACL
MPNKLEHGDTIGIISPSSPVAAYCPIRFKRSVKELQRLGFNIKIGKNALNKLGHLAGSVKERAFDFNQMVKDPKVKMIISTIGGYNSNQLIEHIDFQQIVENPKIILGYSDFTSLLLAINTKTGLTTYMGPSLLPQFGEYGGIDPFTFYWFNKMICSGDLNGKLLPSSRWTEEFLLWDKEDIRPKKYKINPGYLTIKEGVAEGKVISGNMGAMLSLAGTQYFPDFKDKILFLEDDPEETPGSIDRYLTQFRHLEVYNKITGLVIGRFHSNVGFSDDYPLSEIIIKATEGFNFPIIINADFGHTDPMATIPNGINAKLISSRGNSKIKFIN